MKTDNFPTFADAIEAIRAEKNEELRSHRRQTLTDMMDLLAAAHSSQMKLPDSERKTDAELLTTIKSTMSGRYMYIDGIMVDGKAYRFKHDGIDNSVTPVI